MSPTQSSSDSQDPTPHVSGSQPPDSSGSSNRSSNRIQSRTPDRSQLPSRAPSSSCCSPSRVSSSRSTWASTCSAATESSATSSTTWPAPATRRWVYVDQPPLSIWMLAGASGRSSATRSSPSGCCRPSPERRWSSLTGLLARELGGGRLAVALAALCSLVAGFTLAVSSIWSMNVFDLLLVAVALLLLARLINTGDHRLWIPSASPSASACSTRSASSGSASASSSACWPPESAAGSRPPGPGSPAPWPRRSSHRSSSGTRPTTGPTSSSSGGRSRASTPGSPPGASSPARC